MTPADTRVLVKIVSITMHWCALGLILYILTTRRSVRANTISYQKKNLVNVFCLLIYTHHIFFLIPDIHDLLLLFSITEERARM